MSEINDKFHDAIDYFYEINYHLAAQISRLGRPKFVSGYPPTAGVAWDSDKDKVEFLFNRKFFDKLNNEEFYFALAHESMHILNGHIFKMKSVLDKMKSAGDSNKDIARWMRKFNIAADCVVNDTLVNLYNLPKIDFKEAFDVKGDAPVIFYGKETVGCECHDLSVDEVMWLIEDNESGDDESDIQNHEWKSFFDEDGNIQEGFVDSLSDFLEEVGGNSALSGPDRQQLDELVDSMKKSTDAYSRKAGNSAGNATHSISGGKESLKWEKILFRKVARGKFEDRWNRPNRKMSVFYPETILPDSQPKDVEEIFIAIDCSGSIDMKALDLFVSLVRNTPKNFRIKAISFDTVCEEFNIKSETIRSGGGTAFNIIEDYIQDNFRKYPKAVFVLTDGYGNSVTPKYPKRWTWLLYGNSGYGGSNTACIGDMTHYNIYDLMK